MAINVAYTFSDFGSIGNDAVDMVTIPSNSGQTLIVFTFGLNNSGRDFTGVTLGLTPLTSRGSLIVSANGELIARAWTLESPTPGAGAITTTCNQATVNVGRVIVVVAEGSGYSSTNGAGANSVDIVSAAGHLVIGMMLARNASDLAVGAGQTQIVKDLATHGTMDIIASSEQGASLVTTDFTPTGGDDALVLGIDIAANASVSAAFRPYYITG